MRVIADPGIIFCSNHCQDTQTSFLSWFDQLLIFQFSNLFCFSLASSERTASFCILLEHRGHSFFSLRWTCSTNIFYFSLKVFLYFMLLRSFTHPSSHLIYFCQKERKTTPKYGEFLHYQIFISWNLCSIPVNNRYCGIYLIVWWWMSSCGNSIICQNVWDVNQIS